MKNSPRYLLHNIPNTRKGELFLDQFRRYLNREGWELAYRTNGPRKAAALKDGLGPDGYRSSLPKRHATKLRVYAVNVGERKAYKDASKGLWERFDNLTRTLEAANSVERELRRDLDGTVKALDKGHAQIVWLEGDLKAARETLRLRDIELHSLRRFHFQQCNRPALVRWVDWACYRFEALRNKVGV